MLKRIKNLIKLPLNLLQTQTHFFQFLGTSRYDRDSPEQFFPASLEMTQQSLAVLHLLRSF